MKVFSIELHDNEKIEMKIRQHWMLHVWPTLKLLFFSAVGAFGAYYLNKKSIYVDDTLAILLWLAWTLVFFNFWLHHFLHWYLNMYVITNKRIINITHAGIFRRQTTETSFHKVQDVTFKTLGLLSIILNYGDVVVQTAGHSTLIHFHTVPKPRDIHVKIMNILALHHSQETMGDKRPGFLNTKNQEP